MKYPNGWQEKNQKLERTFTFKNFTKALDFVNKVGALAESHNHHPDIQLFGYKNVHISMNTHDAGDIITEKDINLAQEINTI